MIRKFILVSSMCIFGCFLNAGYSQYSYLGNNGFTVPFVLFDDISGMTEMYTAGAVEDLAEIVFTNAISNAVCKAVTISSNRIDNVVFGYVDRNYDQWYKEDGWESSPGLLTIDKGPLSWSFYGIPENWAEDPKFHNKLIINHSTNGIELIGITPPGGKTWNYISVWNPEEGGRQYLGDALEKAGGIKYDEIFTNNVVGIVTNRNPITKDTPWQLNSVSDPRVGNVYVKWIAEDDPEYMWYQQTGWMVQGDYLMSMPSIDSTDPLATRIDFYNAIENPDTEEGTPWIEVSGTFVRNGLDLPSVLFSMETFSNAVIGVVDKVASERITTEVDNAMKEMLGDNWKTTYGTGLGGILAAILASIVWLKKQIGNAEEALRKL